MKPIYFILLGILCGLLAAGILLLLNALGRGHPIELPGIGEVKAQAIIDYRTQHSPFTALEDIQEVSGIGPATYEKLKDLIKIY